VGKVSTTTASDSGLIGPKLSNNLLYSHLRLSERVSGWYSRIASEWFGDEKGCSDAVEMYLQIWSICL